MDQPKLQFGTSKDNKFITSVNTSSINLNPEVYNGSKTVYDGRKVKAVWVAEPETMRFLNRLIPLGKAELPKSIEKMAFKMFATIYCDDVGFDINT